tara:strand:- start:747 stop:1883 length:1137 start_codon:yes stop_codon:yes gene_type:complete
MAQDVVSARTSSFAQLLMALDKLLEPSEAEKRANELTNMIRMRQMEMQMNREAIALETATKYLESDADLAANPELTLQDYSFSGEAQHRFGLYRFGKWFNGPMVKATNPGEVTRSIWNPYRYIKGSHDKLVNPVTTAAAIYAAPTILRTGLGQVLRLGGNRARLKLIQRLSADDVIAGTGLSKNAKLMKDLQKNWPALAKAWEKAVPRVVANLKAQGKYTGTISGSMILSEISGMSDYLASTPSLFDKNQYAQSRNSYFKPEVLGEMHAGIDELKKLNNKVQFAAEQGVAMPESHAMLIKKLKELAPNYSTETQAGQYIRHELESNYKPDEMIEYQEGKFAKTKLIKDQYELDAVWINNTLKTLQGYGPKQGYIYQGY